MQNGLWDRNLWADLTHQFPMPTIDILDDGCDRIPRFDAALIEKWLMMVEIAPTIIRK